MGGCAASTSTTITSSTTTSTTTTNTSNATTTNTTNTTDETVSSACPLSLLGSGCCDNTTLTLIQTGSEDLDACEAACDAHVNCSAFDHTSVASTTAPGASMRLR